MPVVIDLFAGAGGLSLGAERSGFEVAAAVEIDKNAIESHKQNFPNTVHIQKDIMKLSGQEIVAEGGLNLNDLTGIIGGPPCQGFSNIGQGDVNDARNRLFVKFFDIVAELRPTFFVVENVPGIMKDKYDEIRHAAFEKVKCYTLLDPIYMNASEYGAPTTRTRCFFIGYLEDRGVRSLNEEDILKQRVNMEDRTTVIQALEGLPANLRYSSKCTGYHKLEEGYYEINAEHSQSDYFYQRVTANIPDRMRETEYVRQYMSKHIVNGCITTQHSRNVRYRYAKLKYNQTDQVSKSKRLDPDGFCPTLRAGTGPDKGSYQAVRPIHYQYNRVITPREAARLQGFPDWYKLPETIWHGFRQIGNSVSPIVAEKVLSAIHQKLTL